MRTGTSVLLSTAVAVSLLAACGPDGGMSPTSSLATSESKISQGPTDGVPGFPANTELKSAEHSGAWGLVFTDVRVAEHEGFDRIVLEFTGRGIPGWTVSYVDEALLYGSGEELHLGGDAILDIYASGTTWPAAGYYSGPTRFEPDNGGEVSDVHVGGTFEGYTQVLVGIDGDPLPFRVFALTDPSRLVVDVVDGSAD